MKKLIVTTIYLVNAILHTNGVNIDTGQIFRKFKSENLQTRNQGLIEYSLYLFHIKNLFESSDSCANQAIIESLLKEDKNLFISNAIYYRQVCSPTNHIRAQQYLTTALEAALKGSETQLQFLLYINMALLDLDRGMYENATEHMQKAVKYILENRRNRALYFLTLADLQLKTNDKISAFENYNNAVLLLNEIEDDSLKFVSYDKLYSFFNIINDRKKSKDYITLSFELIKGNGKFNIYDSLMLKAKLVDYYLNQNENEVALKIADEVLSATEKNGFYAVENLIFGTLRSNYLSNSKRKEICELYCNRYPKKLEILKITDLKIYNRVQALIFENNNQIDSAMYYWRIAEEETLKYSNFASIAIFFKRKAQFYERQSDLQNALIEFNKFYNYSLQSQYHPFIIESAGILDSIYSAQGNFNLAYYFSKIKSNYTDSNAAQTQKDKLLSIEIENLAKLQDLEKEKQILIKNKNANLQVVIIIGAIIFSIILLVLFSRYKISKNVLKLFSYVTFVLVFEFIVYLLDNIIHEWAHGQPIKIIAVKVVIISLLLPIHHATDYRVVQYLTRKNLVKDHGMSFKQSLFKLWSNFRNWLNIHKTPEIAPETDAAKTD